MGYSNQEMGSSAKVKLLQQITKQLDRLIKVTSAIGTVSTTTTHP